VCVFFFMACRQGVDPRGWTLEGHSASRTLGCARRAARALTYNRSVTTVGHHAETSHSFSVASWLEEASTRPSGRHAQLVTSEVWPRSV
jgi:hypothetical protein